ncbi:MAG: multicopper oxidase domain-containing protein [Vicinamibacteria bacterium]|nr:multicopper oxidase domain-containing protein [Vicinamibacteria bacterium]
MKQHGPTRQKSAAQEMRALHRRQWLRETARAILGASAARAIAGGGVALPLLAVDALAEPLRQPAALVQPLLATPATSVVWPGRTTSLLTFGGSYPSPTLRARVGELFELQFENRLTEATNIHWHGLAVPAEADGYPTDVIPPGGTRQYRFRIADRAGTYWYHPHPDGRTAAQVYGGMAGFFIVEDDADRGLGLPTGEHDVALLLQDRRRTADNSFAYAPSPMDLMSGYLGNTVLVNGTPDAELPIAATRYRFRLLNGSNARIFRVAFGDSRAFDVIAGDGGLLERAVTANALFLAPGERTEILVDFSRDPVNTSVPLISLPFTAGGGGMGMGMGGSPQGASASLLRLVVGRAGAALAPLPARLASIERLDPARAQVQRRFVMDMRMPPFAGALTINARSFDAARVDVRVERGVLEVWEIINISTEPHPFHVHATQFQVVSRSSGALSPHELGLKDTVLVWPGETVRIAIRFDAHAGLYVLHCHNLEHEDAGMMLNLEVL